MEQVLNPAVQLLLFVIAVSVGAGVIKQSINGLTKGQQDTQTAVKTLADAVAGLATASAVNATQHDDIMRQITQINRELGKHGEQIARLRTATHLHANKIQELDPSFNRYRTASEDPET